VRATDALAAALPDGSGDRPALPAERHGPMPGDDIVPDARMVTTPRGHDPRPPASVWPWLIQMGWHRRAGTRRWV
jgi:hypothetical protein